MLTHSGIINELFSICILPPATLSLAFSFFFCPICVCVLLPIAESGAGKVHFDGKDICIPEHSIAVVVVLGHCGDKTLELEHDVLHCSGDTLGEKCVETPFPNSVKAVINPPLPVLETISYILIPFAPPALIPYSHKGVLQQRRTESSELRQRRNTKAKAMSAELSSDTHHVSGLEALFSLARPSSSWQSACEPPDGSAG